ncbi:dolichyl-phosphate-mannose--protein mannosyltransferase [Cellulomonas sp. HZM]|uniref:dolichyl-phosphate-mannose--protein mannosyltransferase n=1 Tax=Cellulomonas sp. HZM TaxID=1454010 RepID=UPI000A906555|nr:phospholipid carrier-dependent glycosyltransferase [Cellulomonas sp. HZM]
MPPATDDDVPATPAGPGAVDEPSPTTSPTNTPPTSPSTGATPAGATPAAATPTAAEDPDDFDHVVLVGGEDHDAPQHRRADTATPPDEDDEQLTTRERLLRRLLGEATLRLDATRRSRVIGWVAPLAVMVLGGILRFWHLGTPHRLVFDETYYVKDAFSLLTNGYEANWDDDSNPKFEAGDTSGLRTDAEYVVHPLVGKWLIAFGIKLGGGIDSSAAWRLSAAIFGTIAILMLARIARRLFASTTWGTLAGLFLALDGQAIVMSRVSLLDPFLMFFVLAAFGALLLDREQARRRLAERTALLLDAGEPLGDGPGLGWRWWRFAAAVLLGLACGTKWSGIYFLAVFGLMSVLWDMTARKTIGVRRWVWAGFAKDGIFAGVVMVVTTFVVYLATWTTWFTHAGAWDRQWAAQNPGQGVGWLPPALRSLWHYHVDMWNFHNGLDSPHPYASKPIGWIVQWRPTSMFYPTEVSHLSGQRALDACGASSCSQPIVALGNPILWWVGAAAILVALVWLVRYRDWRAGAVLSGIAAGWLPWFAYSHRTIFTFYSIAFVPWVALTVAYVLSLIVGPPDDDVRGRRNAQVAVGVVVAVIVAAGFFFYPVWSGQVMPYQQWHLRMWLKSWV